MANLLFLWAIVFIVGSAAETVSYDWNVTWVSGAPDGFYRPIVGINGAWPCPPIQATVGDTVEVTLHNQLGNQTTGMHFHGMKMLDSNEVDGASGTSQCPLIPGRSMKYSFKASCPSVRANNVF